MKEQSNSSGSSRETSSSKSSGGKGGRGSSNIEAQGKRIHHGIEHGPIDTKGKFTNWPGMGK